MKGGETERGRLWRKEMVGSENVRGMKEGRNEKGERDGRGCMETVRKIEGRNKKDRNGKRGIGREGE